MVFADATQPLAVLERSVRPRLAHKCAGAEFAALAALLRELYWHVLDVLNTRAGRARTGALQREPRCGSWRRPARRARPRCMRSATLKGARFSRWRSAVRGRRCAPGTTCAFRCERSTSRGALAALNLRRNEPEEFIVAPQPVPARPGVSRSVVDEHFRIEHLAPTLARVDRRAGVGRRIRLHAARGRGKRLRDGRRDRWAAGGAATRRSCRSAWVRTASSPTRRSASS